MEATNGGSMHPPAAPAESSRVRKRVDSEPDAPGGSISVFKRPRLSMSRSTSNSSTNSSFDSPSTLTPERSLFLSTFTGLAAAPQDVGAEMARVRARSLSRRSSMTTSDSPGSPSTSLDNPLAHFPGLRDRIIRPKRDPHALLRRSVSAASLYASSSSPAPPEIVYAEESARDHMKQPKFVIDFTTPTPAAPVLPTPEPAPQPIHIRGLPPLDPQGPTPPAPITDVRLLTPEVYPSVLACSQSGILFFTRTNRIHWKNLMLNEEVGQLCKLKDSHGTFTAVACGSDENPNVVAWATSKGTIAIHDVQTKKRIIQWNTQPVTALAWNDKLLTVGYASGAIRHYDTRHSTTFSKMKDQAVVLATRHQSPITRLAWNFDGRLLASADQQGNVLCWKVRDKVPLEVGEPGQTRMKKIKHEAAISALSWCPWSTKVLLTADVKGTLHLWRADHEISGSNALSPAKVETGAAITGIQWSTQCKEFVTTHGYKVPEAPAATPASRRTLLRNQPPSQDIENTVSVWQYPNARFVVNVRVPENKVPLGNSATCAGTTKVVFTVPEDGKILICDVWAKRKQQKIKRQSSLDFAGQIR